jgi:hypothetical protein
MKIRKLIVIAMVIALMTSSLGCKGKSKADIQNELDEAIFMLNQSETKVQSLETALKALNGNNSGSEISEIEIKDNSAFMEVSNMLVFKSPFIYMGAIDAASDGYVNITKNVALMPSSNWEIRFSGPGIELSHPSGIGGTIKVGRITNVIQPADLAKSVIDPFLTKLSPSNISYGDIFIGDTFWGKSCIAKIGTQEEPYMILLGTLGIGTSSVNYIFMYSGENDNTKNELVEMLLSTLRVNGSAVTVGR